MHHHHHHPPNQQHTQLTYRISTCQLDLCDRCFYFDDGLKRELIKQTNRRSQQPMHQKPPHHKHCPPPTPSLPKTNQQEVTTTNAPETTPPENKHINNTQKAFGPPRVPKRPKHRGTTAEKPVLPRGIQNQDLPTLGKGVLPVWWPWKNCVACFGGGESCVGCAVAVEKTVLPALG